MFHKSATPFRKGVNCPSSNQVLTFLGNDMGEGQGSAVRAHLSFCDFCSAEAEVYRRFPDLFTDEVAVAEMPPHLYELARVLLSAGRAEVEELDALVSRAVGIDSGLK